MILKDKRTIVRAFARQYQKGRKKEKSLLLVVGYQRLDTHGQLKILNHLYDLLSDYQNFFQPVMRLKEKVRNGTRLTRRYDQPKTAYQRVLAYPGISSGTKETLKKRFKRLNPKRLLLDITRLGRKLTKK